MALKSDLLDPYPQSEFNVVLRKLHTAQRLSALHCWTGSHALSQSTGTQHSMQLESGLRLYGGKVVFEPGSPIRIGSGSKVLCGDPNCIRCNIVTN